MGNGIPPSRQYATMYSAFEFEATKLHSPVKSALDSFEADVSSAAEAVSLWTFSDTEWNSLLASLLGKAATAAATVPDWGQSHNEHARAYMLGEKLASLCVVGSRTSTTPHSYPATIAVAVNSVPWGTTTIAPPPTPTTMPSGAFNIDEIWAQHDQPEMFMLWACKPFLTPANMPWLGRLLDVMALALPSMLYTIKARAAVERPYEVSATWPMLLPRQGHSSWPGGHAYVAGALGLLFNVAVGRTLTPANQAILKKRLTKAARRIAGNRERAGLHWTADSDDGLSLGKFTMEQMLNAAAASPTGVGEISDLALLVSKV